MTETKIPVIDLSFMNEDDADVQASLARMIDDEFCRTGFITVVRHGVPADVLDSAEQVARAFFGMALDRKMQACRPNQLMRGYIPNNAIAAGRAYGQATETPPDLMEGFAIGPSRAATEVVGASKDLDDGSNLWPDTPAQFRTSLDRYYGEMEKLALRLVPLFARALRLRSNYLLPYFNEHNGVLRLHHYPKQHRPPLAGQLRIAPHTDHGAFTILRGDEKSGGLQILDKSGAWIDVQTSGDCFVVNVGEMMKRWTNGRWQATIHRVINPPNSAQNVDRLSIPFFFNPSADARIECLPTCLDPGAQPLHPPVTAGEFRKQRLAEAA